ncbi:hypothetical protein D3C75_458100 [compost metagenome]
MPVPGKTITAFLVTPPQAAFCRNNDLIPPAFDRLPNDFLTVPKAVNRGSINYIDAQIQRGMNGANRLRIIGIWELESSTNTESAESNDRGLYAALSNLLISHRDCILPLY